MDYQSNSKKAQEKKEEAKPKDKKLEKIVEGPVVVQKRSLGGKIKDLISEADFKSVFRWVWTDVLIPGAKGIIFDASTRSIERVMYKTDRRLGGTGQGTRMIYNSPVRRQYQDDPRERILRSAPPVPIGPRRTSAFRGGVVLSSREEAEHVLQTMRDIIDKYDAASVADLKELVGLEQEHTDNKFGWDLLEDVQIRHIRDGFLLDLPEAEPLSS